MGVAYLSRTHYSAYESLHTYPSAPQRTSTCAPLLSPEEVHSFLPRLRLFHIGQDFLLAEFRNLNCPEVECLFHKGQSRNTVQKTSTMSLRLGSCDACSSGSAWFDVVIVPAGRIWSAVNSDVPGHRIRISPRGQ